MNQHGSTLFRTNLPAAAWRVLTKQGLRAFAAKSWRALGRRQPPVAPAPQPDPIHKDRLRRLLPYPWFQLGNFHTDGDTLVIHGIAPEKIDGQKGPEITLNGHLVGRYVTYRPAPAIEAQFWFVADKWKISEFELAIPLTDIPLDDRPYFEIGLTPSAPGQPVNPYKKQYYPKDLSAYQNVADGVRQKRVVNWIHSAGFVHEGYSHYHIYRTLAERIAGRSMTSFESLLDWGCGCGRVTRHMIANREPNQRVTGIDIDADNVSFCASHYRGGEFQPVDLLPPTRFPAGSFDFVIATSVMTHLDEPTQFRWLEEIRRITRPGAVVILTVHGNTAVAWSNCGVPWLDNWERVGIDATMVLDHLKGFIPSDDYYRNTFHTQRYIRETWSKYFAIKSIAEGAIAHQDAVVMVRE